MTLKHELTSYFIRNESELGKEEVFNTLEILNKYNEDLDDLYPYDSWLITRLITENTLVKKVELVTSLVSREYDTLGLFRKNK